MVVVQSRGGRGALMIVAGAAMGLSPSLALGQETRTFDGTQNNQDHSAWGSAHTQLGREDSGAHYVDGVDEMTHARPGARAISNAIFDQSTFLANSRGMTSMVWQWGQFLDHDIDLTPTNGVEFMPMPIPAWDPDFDPTGTGNVMMPFTRSIYDTGAVGARQQMNEITTWIDGSNVYGSDASRATLLRTGVGGRLNTSAGNLMPYNTTGAENAGGDTRTDLFIGGDVRANEQPGLAAMHTLFVREHNYWADRLAGENPGWNDEQIYQMARRIVGAEMQRITYNEFLPALLGDANAQMGDWAGYDDEADPTISNAFSTAAYRMGHTMLNEELLSLNNDGTAHASGHLSLADGFFNSSFIATHGIDSMLKGLTEQLANEVDAQLTDAVRNQLFGNPEAGETMALDLAALNIQRGRDHGLADYNTMREDFGLDRLTSFGELTDDAVLAAELQALYGSIDNVDAWVGMLSENKIDGSSVGELMGAILIDQFRRLRDADRFFYLNDEELADYLAEIEGTTLADIMMRNTELTGLRGNVFLIPSPGTGALLAFAGLGLARRRRR